MSNLIDKIEVQSTELEACQVEKKYTISATTIKEETNKTVKEFSAHADLPGFRKGKVPAALIKKKFQDKINEELMNKFFSTAFQKTTLDKDFDMISYALAEEAQPEIKAGSDFTFTIKFDVAPQIDIDNYKELELVKPTNEISEEDIEKQLTHYKEVYAEYKTKEAAAEAGDMLKVSYTSDFEIAEDAPQAAKNQVSSQENWIWLNEPETIPGAIEALTGAEAGKEYTFTSVYAEDFREAAVAGQTINYTVNVQEVQTRASVETNEELATKMNLDGVDALKAQITANIETEVEQRNNYELKTAALDKLCKATAEFDFPPSTLSTEVNKQLQAMAHSVKSEEEAEEFKKNEEANRKEAENKAKERLRRFFISRNIAKKESITVEQSEIDSQIQMLSQHYGYPVEQLRQIMEQSGGLNDIHIDLLVNKVTDLLVDNAKVS